MVNLTRIYTRTGDDGTTALGDMSRVSKNDPRLVAYADVLVSAGGTMNREAAVLGTPVWSIFEGRLGAVDEQLVREGRLRLLDDPARVELLRKPAPAGEGRVRRDPQALLRLALPWLPTAA